MDEYRLKHLKRDIKTQVEKCPTLYEPEELIDVILSIPEEYDEMVAYAEWVAIGVTNDGDSIMKPINYAFKK